MTRSKTVIAMVLLAVPMLAQPEKAKKPPAATFTCKPGWTKQGDVCTRQTYDGCNTTTWTDNGFSTFGASTAVACREKDSALIPGPDASATLSWKYPVWAEPLRVESDPTVEFVAANGKTMFTLRGIHLEDNDVEHAVLSFDQPGSGQVDRLSNVEYARLETARKALVAAQETIRTVEKELAQAHGVKWVTPAGCRSTAQTGAAVYTICLPPEERPDKRYEFRGQFLLIDLPSPTVNIEVK